ncbi:MAG: CvpA family protein [Patescibacteria group bacterium]|nr:CvpA family protein [Patescibacteria group bacterium]
MTLFDLILILIVFGFIWFDFWFGLIYALGGLAGLIVGVAVASRWYDELAIKIVFLLGGNINLANIISFLVIYIVVNRLVGFVFFILDRILRPITHLPFLKAINRLGGALIGFVTGSLTVGLFLYFIVRFPLPWLINLIENSKLAQHFINLAKILLPLLPEILKKIESAI